MNRVPIRRPTVLAYLALGLTLCAASAAHAQLAPDPVREGYLAHTTTNGLETLYFYRVSDDGTVTLREGPDEAAPAVTVPAFVARTVVERLEAVAPRDTRHVERTAVAVQGNTVWVRWAKQFNLLWVLAAGGLLAGTVLGAGTWWWVRRARAEHDRLLASRAHLAAGQEAERARLAQELHDGPLQDLHGIRIRLGTLPPTLATPPTHSPASASSPDLEAIEDDLVTVTAELRTIMADLHPPALTPFGLAAAIQAHVDRFRRRYPHVACRTELGTGDRRLPDATRLALFRVCQEALSNVAKHAHADSVDIHLQVEHGRAFLRVRDDGRGFTEPGTASFAENGSFGLSNMAARAEAVGATLSVTSEPGNGTTVLVEAPFRNGRPAPTDPRRTPEPR